MTKYKHIRTAAFNYDKIGNFCDRRHKVMSELINSHIEKSSPIEIVKVEFYEAYDADEEGKRQHYLGVHIFYNAITA